MTRDEWLVIYRSCKSIKKECNDKHPDCEHIKGQVKLIEKLIHKEMDELDDQ